MNKEFKKDWWNKNQSWIRDKNYSLEKIVEKEVKDMTPNERLLFDKGVESIKREICPVHGDVCKCPEQTKIYYWNQLELNELFIDTNGKPQFTTGSGNAV